MKRILYLLIFIILTACNAQQHTNIKIISLENLSTIVQKDSIQLLDVRTPKEYNAGHIGNAINIPISNKKKFIQQTAILDKNKPIYVYCQAGYRSKRASKLLAKKGFTAIYDFSDGYRVWSKK